MDIPEIILKTENRKTTKSSFKGRRNAWNSVESFMESIGFTIGTRIFPTMLTGHILFNGCKYNFYFGYEGEFSNVCRFHVNCWNDFPHRIPIREMIGILMRDPDNDYEKEEQPDGCE